jgi:flagellar protein FlaG
MSTVKTIGPTGTEVVVQPVRADAQRAAPPAEAPEARAPVAAPETVEPIDLKMTVDNLNRYLKSIDQSVQFEIDDQTGTTVVRVVDRVTAEVIRQMPSNEMLAVARALAKLQGVLVDDSA